MLLGYCRAGELTPVFPVTLPARPVLRGAPTAGSGQTLAQRGHARKPGFV